MTQEIKQKLEQAAAYHQGSGLDFMAGAKTILENPGEWGLYPPDPAQVVLAEGYHRLQSENEQLREALEHLERFTSDNPDYEFINHRLKETLKQ